MPFQKGQVNYRRQIEGSELETSEKVVREIPIVANFTLADVPDRGMWLLKRLSNKWPHISEATFSGRARAWIGSNSHKFVKSAHAIALFRITYTELDARPLGEEVFLFSKEPHVRASPSERDAVAIYRHAARWAKDRGCSRLTIAKISDHGESFVINQLADVSEDLDISIQL